MKIASIVILLSFAISALSASANPVRCEGIFGQPRTKVTGLFESPANHQDPTTLAKVVRLTEKLVEANKENISRGSYWNRPELANATDLKIELTGTSTNDGNFTTYAFQGTGSTPTGNVSFPVNVRSNGEVAFLDSTWQYRDNNSFEVKRYNAVHFREGSIRTVDQGETILESLPEQMTIARQMSNVERSRWISGESYYPSSLYGKRVHFMPNKSRFNKSYEPYFIHLSRAELLEFYRRGELEINVYESSGMDLTSIKLDFELVFIGETAIQNLAPIMKTQLATPENVQR